MPTSVELVMLGCSFLSAKWPEALPEGRAI